MKKLLAISLFLVTLNAYSQNTTSLPSGTNSSIISVRTKGLDSLHQTWIAFPGIGYNRFYSATEANLRTTQSYATQTDITNATTIAFWGDSFTAGNGATGVPYRYPSVATRYGGFIAYNGGTGGNTSTQILTRFLAAPERFKNSVVIWSGYNNYTDTATVLDNIQTMIDTLEAHGNTRIIVLSVMNSGTQVIGNTGYNTIIALNNYMKARWPTYYLDIRAYVVSQYNPALPQDVLDHANDVPPLSLRSDNLHLNNSGYFKVGRRVALKIDSLVQETKVLTTSTLAYSFYKPPVLGAVTPNDVRAKSLRINDYYDAYTTDKVITASDSGITRRVKLSTRQGGTNSQITFGNNKVLVTRGDSIGESNYVDTAKLNALANIPTGGVVFSNGTKLTHDNTKFFWDNTLKRLGIGIAAPLAPLHISGATGELLRLSNTTATSYGSVSMNAVGRMTFDLFTPSGNPNILFNNLIIPIGGFQTNGTSNNAVLYVGGGSGGEINPGTAADFAFLGATGLKSKLFSRAGTNASVTVNNQAYFNWALGTQGVTLGTGAVAPIAGYMGIKPAVVTLTGGSATNTATLYVDNTTVGGTSGAYSTWSRGNNRLDTLNNVALGLGGSFGTANQMIRRNAANTANEWFTPSFGVSSIDTTVIRTVSNSWSKAQADARFLKLSGGTVTGNVIHNGTVDFNSASSFNNQMIATGSAAYSFNYTRSGMVQLQNSAGTFKTTLSWPNVTADQNIAFPNTGGVGGTIALTSDLTGKANLTVGNSFTGDQDINGLLSGRANYGVITLPSTFYNTSASKWLIANNRSNGSGETDYFSAPGNGGVAFGGHRWYNVNSLGVETVQMDLNGTTSALTVTGPLVAAHNAATGTDDVLVLSGSPANEIKKRSLANFKSDLGMPISGSYSYSVTAETTFTVTIGTTMANNTYKVNVTPTSALGRQPLSVENKTTTTFDVVFTGLPLSPGTLTFDWVVYP